jgi:hypothetical protein
MRALSAAFAVVRKSVQASSWIASDGGLDLEGGAQAVWDPSVDIDVSRSVTIDMDAFVTETGLYEGTTVRLCAGWFCDRTRTREVIDHRNVEVRRTGSLHELFVRVEAPGSSLAHAVSLETRVILVARAEGSSPIAARIPGSVLWEDRNVVDLEGLGSRFPTEWADFATSVYPEEAAWALDWSPQDLDCSTLGAIRLLLNQKHAVVSELLRENPPSMAAKLVWDAIRVDVARQLVLGALSNDDFVNAPDAFHDGTLGATIRRMLRTYFPHDGIPTLRSLRERNPAQLETRLQASLRAFDQR